MPDTNSLGKQLAAFDSGDEITVGVNDTKYTGTVTQTDRRKCELIQGFMESGYLEVYVKLNSVSAENAKFSASEIVIGAEEDTPRSWEQPSVAAYDNESGETTTVLGEVRRIERD